MKIALETGNVVRKVVVISISLGEKPVTIVTQKNHKMPKITYRKKRYMSMQVGLLELSKLRKKICLKTRKNVCHSQTRAQLGISTGGAALTACLSKGDHKILT